MNRIIMSKTMVGLALVTTFMYNMYSTQSSSIRVGKIIQTDLING